VVQRQANFSTAGNCKRESSGSAFRVGDIAHNSDHIVGLPGVCGKQWRLQRKISFARMLVCTHEREPFGAPMCAHLQTCREPWIKYVKWYIGSGLATELLCVPCAERREQGLPVAVESVCEECFEYATTEVCDLVRTGGKPEIRIRPETFNGALKETAMASELGTIVDIAPVYQDSLSLWLILTDDCRLIRFDADTSELTHIGSTDLQPEPPHKSWSGPNPRQRLHASRNGAFIAVVNDYGRYGQVIDARSGKLTMSLDGGDYYPGTVPLSFTFADLHGRVIAIHRTAWNRLDVSDPATGKLLTDRSPTSYRSGEERPEHYLDYFHGALYVSPNGTHILDDGWVWHPIGIPTAWSLERWISDNAWESEDGPTRLLLCGRSYYWDHAVAWLDESRVAIGGIGDDDNEIIDGALIFEVTSPAGPTGRWRADLRGAREVTAFPGPGGTFFSDGKWLFSSDEMGLARWDTQSGERTGHLEGFRPTHHHRGASELVQLNDRTLTRWRIT